MTVEAPSPPNRPQRSKGTAMIVLGGLALVAFFILVNAFDSKSGGKNTIKTGTPPAVGTLSVAGTPQGMTTPTLKAVPAGTLNAATLFTSLQGYKLTVAKGWRIIPAVGAANTDLILQAPAPQRKASIFTITVVDTSKRLVGDPKLELPGKEAFGSFSPLPARSITLNGTAAAQQEATITTQGVPARILQYFASHHKRAYNFIGICPQGEFEKRRPQIQQMMDSLQWIPPKQPALPSPTF